MSVDLVKSSIVVLKELRKEMHDKVDACVIQQFDDALDELENELAKSKDTVEVKLGVLVLLGKLLEHLPDIQRLFDRFN